MKVILAIIILSALFVTTVSADIVSVNSGGDNQIVITPGGHIESFFTGLVPQSAGGIGGGGGRAAAETLFDIAVVPESVNVVQGNVLPIDIVFTNTVAEDTGVMITYYVEQVVLQPGWTETFKFGERTEQALILPLGVYKITRHIELPANATLGEWNVVVEYESDTRKYEAFAGIKVVDSIWPEVQFFLIFIVLFTILTWYLLIYRRRRDEK